MSAAVYIVPRTELDALARTGVTVSDHVGMLDFVRLVAGNGDPPTAEQPVAVHGLDTVLAATDPRDRHRVSASLRRAILAGKAYFEWKQIPLVFVVDGRLDGTLDGGGLTVHTPAGRVSVAEVLGRGYAPTKDHAWWWGPQLG